MHSSRRSIRRDWDLLLAQFLYQNRDRAVIRRHLFHGGIVAPPTSIETNLRVIPACKFNMMTKILKTRSSAWPKMSNTDLTLVSCSKLHPGCDAVVHFLLRCNKIMLLFFFFFFTFHCSPFLFSSERFLLKLIQILPFISPFLVLCQTSYSMFL